MFEISLDICRLTAMPPFHFLANLEFIETVYGMRLK